MIGSGKLLSQASQAVVDPHHQVSSAAVVLFDIERHISIHRREPNLVEAKALYRRWCGVDPDSGEAVA